MEEEKIDGVDKIVNINLKQKTIPKKRKFKKLPKQEFPIKRKRTSEEKKEAINNFNNNPTTKEFGVIAIKKSTYWILMIFGILLITTLIGGTIWFNISFYGKDFAPNLINNIDTPDVNMTNNYEHITNIYINNSVEIPEELIIKIQNSS